SSTGGCRACGPRSTGSAARPWLLLDPARLRRVAQALAAVDHAALPVLVGEPRHSGALAHAGPAVVAHAAGERLLEALPLLVGELDRVVVAAHRLELALHD